MRRFQDALTSSSPRPLHVRTLDDNPHLEMSEYHTAIELDAYACSHPIPDTLVPTFSAAQLYDSLPLSDPLNLRVIDLDEDGGNSNAPLSGTLRVVNLKDSPSFAALSYVWGSISSPPDTISCNGCIIEVSTNCHEALRSLRSLRSLRHLHGQITIWVDNFCMNQQDDREKETQIPLMEQIYTYAEPTFIWLGKGSESTDRAMACIKHASSMRFLPVEIPWYRRGECITPSDDRGLARRRLWKLWFKTRFRWKKFQKKHKQYLESSQDVNSLLGSPWMHRIWTFQEIVLASSPVVVCGSNTCDWAIFSQGVDLLYDAEPSIRFSFFRDTPTHNLNLAKDLRNIYAWMDVIKFWRSISRPTSWNGIEFRAAAKSSSISVDTYHAQNVCQSLPSSWLHVTSWLLSVFCLIMILILSLSIVTHLPSQLRRIPESEQPDGDRSSKLFPLYLTGWCLTVGLLLSVRLCKFGTVHTWSVSGVTNPFHEPIPMIVRALRDRQASHSSDKSFGLQGVLQRLGLKISAPDYEKPLRQVYLELFVTLIRKDSRLVNLLLDAGGMQPAKPSWVPNWDKIDDTAWFAPDLVSGLVDYQVSPNILELKPLVNIENEKLNVRGKWLSKISFVSDGLAKADDIDETSDEECISAELWDFITNVQLWLLAVRVAISSKEQPDIALERDVRDALLVDTVELGGRDKDVDIPPSFSKHGNAFGMPEDDLLEPFGL
ncbi:hypothetical protein K402DRAFT_221388 [Aulographum hederae CBS 113979]|uniref:Heterokaryon incompatibility domain-containing protein n=1 Tax=Aulographum hederae CBS 113979 TaxID=1176131 RepID=A0A6G1GLM0_9PEZI|nr:hypothetical protein K402DRAFT_221388 [Aulographum hederae CBS 113979]